MTPTTKNTKTAHVSAKRFMRVAPDVIEKLIKSRSDYPNQTTAAIARRIFESGDELDKFEQQVFNKIYGGKSAQDMKVIIDDLHDDFIRLLRQTAKLP